MLTYADADKDMRTAEEEQLLADEQVALLRPYQGAVTALSRLY
jgi:hypothetical protein